MLLAALSLNGCSSKSENYQDTEENTTPNTVDTQTTAQTEASETVSAEKKSSKIKAEDLPGATDIIWQPVPMTTQAQYDARELGGEGGQWMLYITFAYTDGNIAYAGSDVGGMYRSSDAGKSWTPCTVGINSSAATGIAVDPTNSNRVLAVGCNSGAFDANGLYISTDSGATFRSVLPQKIVGHRDFRPQIAFDMSSSDDALGGCKTVYWSRETQKYSNGGYTDSALFRSDDGGESWSKVCSDAKIAGAQIFCSSKTGALYAANGNGAFISTDHGESFTQMLDGKCLSMDVIPNMAESIYVTKQDALYVSYDGGESFSAVSKSGYPSNGYPSHLRVSPANPDYMALQNDMLTGKGQYISDTYFSHDGGKSWKKSERDTSGSFIPFNARQNNLAWHPTDESICLSFGGDYIMRSTDGGESFKMSNNGYNGCCFTKFAFNVNNPDLIAVSNQDYSGSISIDGGQTWKYCSFYESWGGFSYGAYMADADTVLFIARDDANKYGLGAWKYVIMRSTDGGRSFKSTGATVSGSTNILGVVGSDDILIAGEYRSEDKGASWNKMAGCKAVYTYELDCDAIYGGNDEYVVKSTDNGETWQEIAKLTAEVCDLAYDNTDDTVWALSSDGFLFRIVGGERTFVRIPEGRSMRPRSIACDPFDGDIIYIGSALDIEKSNTSVIRSLDGGMTWENLTRTVDNGITGPDGGVEVSFLRTNPETGLLYTIGGCRGMWKLDKKA